MLRKIVIRIERYEKLKCRSIQRKSRTKAEGMEMESNIRILSRTEIIQVMSTSHDLLVQQMLNLGLNK